MKVVRVPRPFAIVPEWVLYHPDLSSSAVRMFACLESGKYGLAVSSDVGLANRLGMSVRSLRRPLLQLVAVGAVIVHRGPSGSGVSTYELATDEPLTKAEAP